MDESKEISLLHSSSRLVFCRAGNLISVLIIAVTIDVVNNSALAFGLLEIYTLLPSTMRKMIQNRQ